MEVTGKIIQVLEEQSGVSSRTGKAWKKREYVLETTDSQFPQKIHFNFFGDRADQYPLKEGQIIKLSFDINSREFNGRWYTDISGWRAEEVIPGNTNNGPTSSVSANQSVGNTETYIPPVDLAPSGPNDDLPF